MADGFWNRQQPLLHPGGILKRPRTDYGNSPFYFSNPLIRLINFSMFDSQSISINAKC